ncbi:MAG: AAA family ATPase [Candidatus Acidiferrum sp.]
MDNYRGFSETLIPLRRATFLVGENSTGKSSFLSVAYLLSTPAIILGRNFWQGELYNLGGFKDIVSVTSDDQSSFTIGIAASNTKAKGKRADANYVCLLLRFCDEDGVPRLSCVAHYENGLVTNVLFHEKKAYFKTIPRTVVPNTQEKVSELMLKVFKDMPKTRTGLNPIPAELPPDPPLPLILSVIASSQRGLLKRKKNLSFEFTIPGAFPMMNWFWLAPIRTKPLRIYPPFKTDFTPEGEHTPYVIRKNLDSPEKAERFQQLLSKFGESSGLFSEVKAHAFGGDPSAPFEVIVSLHGKSLNIANVGYGVSQVLPVVVEMITRPRGHGFAIQQPEVHLHPLAQAALGDLIHFLVEEEKQHYLIETHSDYLIDRFRLQVKKTGHPKNSQVVFFERTDRGNRAHVLVINEKGQYPAKQPDAFRRFFINEEVKLLEI